LEDEMTSTEKAKLTRLGNLKMEMAKLEKEMKKVQEWIFTHLEDPPKKFELKNGKSLCLSHRDNWSKPDNQKVAKEIGKDVFMKYATITKTNIAKARGEQAVSALVDKGILEITSTTRYYSLKSKC